MKGRMAVWTLMGRLCLIRIVRDLFMYLFICGTYRPKSDPLGRRRPHMLVLLFVFLFTDYRTGEDAAFRRCRCLSVAFPPGGSRDNNTPCFNSEAVTLMCFDG